MGLVYMPTATFRLSLVIPARMSRMTGSSLRMFNAFFDPDILLTIEKCSLVARGP